MSHMGKHLRESTICYQTSPSRATWFGFKVLVSPPLSSQHPLLLPFSLLPTTPLPLVCSSAFIFELSYGVTVSLHMSAVN